ncbi:MAG: NusG domain II-containing protein [bacterium]|nr:NusG domain II-containing protein [bacterium]
MNDSLCNSEKEFSPIFRLTPADKVLIGVVLLAIGLSIWWVFKGNKAEIVEIQTPKAIKRINLSVRPQTVSVHGVLGTTTIEVQGKKVRVVSSPCSQKICVKMGWRGKNGETIVCLPNKIVVRIISPRQKQKI